MRYRSPQEYMAILADHPQGLDIESLTEMAYPGIKGYDFARCRDHTSHIIAGYHRRGIVCKVGEVMGKHFHTVGIFAIKEAKI